mgnify:CR=1 FL=1
MMTEESTGRVARDKVAIRGVLLRHHAFEKHYLLTSLIGQRGQRFHMLQFAYEFTLGAQFRIYCVSRDMSEPDQGLGVWLSDSTIVGHDLLREVTLRGVGQAEIRREGGGIIQTNNLGLLPIFGAIDMWFSKDEDEDFKYLRQRFHSFLGPIMVTSRQISGLENYV